MRIEDTITVQAEASEVWDAIADPARHSAWHPFVTGIAGEHRLGANRTCQVLIGDKPGETKERCVEDDAPRRIAWAIEEDSSGFGRMVADWRSGFALERHNGAVVVTAHSAFEPKDLRARVLGPLIRRKFHAAQRAILAGLKDASEAPR